MAVFLTRDFELAVKEETSYGTDPTLSAASFFKHKVGFGFTKKVSRYNRDQDADAAVADVITTHKGRESSEWEVQCDLIPSGNAVTPTAPDIGEMLLALFGASQTGTAHTTTDAGSSGTSIVLTAGGGAASGIPTAGGVFIACDVSAAVGVEVRFVVSRSTDTLTIDRAFTSDPATGRAVSVGVTYQLSQSATKSLRIHTWAGGGDNMRYAMPGAICQGLTLAINGAQDNPVPTVSLKGIGGAVVAHTLARPTPTTAGVPLIPTASKVWIGANAATKIVSAELNVTNILDLRMNDISSLAPTGVKRTANASRYAHSLKLDGLIESGTIEGYYSGAGSLTAYDVLVQLGVAVGTIVCYRARKWIPDVPLSAIDGEVGFAGEGRLYGASGDDSIYLGFL